MYNNDLGVKIVATVTGNGTKTVRTLLTELYQVFSTLSDNDKMRCKLIFAVYPLNISAMGGTFDGFRLGADIEVVHVVLSNGTYVYANLSTNPPTVTDASSEIVPSTVSYKLILI